MFKLYLIEMEDITEAILEFVLECLKFRRENRVYIQTIL
jgi:hypothetical protein